MTYKLVDGKFVKDDSNFINGASSKRTLFNALVEQLKRAEAAEAERDELARQLARLQRDYDAQAMRLHSAESGMALLIKEYDKAMTRLAHYEQVTA